MAESADTTTTIIATYSALVSTFVFAWQMYTRFQDGPRLKVTAGGNRKLAGPGFVDPKTYVMINATNIGNRATTIEVVGMYAFDGWWKRLWRNPEQSWVINPHTAGHSTPHVLEPGRKFTGLAIQTPEVVEQSRSRLLYLSVAHSMAKRDILVRLGPIADSKTLKEK